MVGLIVLFCQYCIENDYMLHATKEDKELCDMMYGGNENKWKRFGNTRY